MERERAPSIARWQVDRLQREPGCATGGIRPAISTVRTPVSSVDQRRCITAVGAGRAAPLLRKRNATARGRGGDPSRLCSDFARYALEQCQLQYTVACKL